MPSSLNVGTKEAKPSSTGKQGSKDDATQPRAPRQRRLNYKHIHRFPLPLSVHPLPTLIPHNPLSIISIALSYLTYLVSPPSHERFSAYFDIPSSSIHVTDPKAIRALWEMGFFGKGSLSRSEPTWLEREKKRKGLLGVNTSEEATGNRRIERREWKLERARKEKEAIAQLLRAEAAAREGLNAVAPQAADPLGTHAIDNDNVSKDSVAPAQNAYPTPEPATKRGDAVEKSTLNGTKVVRFSSVVDTIRYDENSVLGQSIEQPAELDSTHLEDEEHLQLSNEDAFFLAYGLGVLQVHEANMDSIISVPRLFSLLRGHSYFPPHDFSTPPPEPDDRFIVSYVAYHHFRSLGWVVRSGVKFGVDLLLYNRGPVFSHAEFAVVVIPTYENSYWTETEAGRAKVSRKASHSWWWLHCVNRVQAQVKKTLVLCYVDIPPPALHEDAADEVDIGAILRSYKVREMTIRRWVPNRSRD